jgi:hypothetical protein
LRIELAMTFKAVFLNIWPSANPDMGVHGPIGAVSGCNILILPVDASVLRPPARDARRRKRLFHRLRRLEEWTKRVGFAMNRSIERRRLPRVGGITEKVQ